MQSQTVALLSVAEGESRIYETVFESRFGVVPELRKMGADMRCDGDCVKIRGIRGLCGTVVNATDLRSGAALVMAGLAAEGETRIYGYDYIARGYEDICGTLRELGAEIVLCDENDEN
jgi:UDP-N-acetylglucosamine 1-carboxyvinyltransferase